MTAHLRPRIMHRLQHLDARTTLDGHHQGRVTGGRMCLLQSLGEGGGGDEYASIKYDASIQ